MIYGSDALNSDLPWKVSQRSKLICDRLPAATISAIPHPWLIRLTLPLSRECASLTAKEPAGRDNARPSVRCALNQVLPFAAGGLFCWLLGSALTRLTQGCASCAKS
jgi:hypothetical protein